MVVLGIDPGINGALAVYSGRTNLVQFWDTPTHTIKINRKKRSRIDAAMLLDLLREIVRASPGIKMAVIEEPTALPVGNGMELGKAFGLVHMAALAQGVPCFCVKPSQWKSALAVPADKDAARARASELIPHGHVLWPLKKHDGRAEAAMLAYYGSKLLQPGTA